MDPRYVLTAKHNIVANPNKITVGFKNGDLVRATVHARHPTLDLLILKLDSVRYEKPLELHPDIRRVRQGQTVKAIGFPGDGWDIAVDAYQGKATNGIFNIGDVELALFKFKGMADTGVSGGPVLIGGKLVGVESGTFEGFGITCVNTHPVRDFLEKKIL